MAEAPLRANHNDSGSWVTHRQKQRRTARQLGRSKITVVKATNSFHKSPVNWAAKRECANMLFTSYQKVRSCTSKIINKFLLPPDRWSPIGSFQGSGFGVQPLLGLGALLITTKWQWINHRRRLVTPMPRMLQGHGGRSRDVSTSVST